MEPSDSLAGGNPPVWDEAFNGDDDWSSDSDSNGAPAGYTLLQNEEDDHEESEDDFDPREDVVTSSDPVVVESLTSTSENSLRIAFKTISPEEEQRLRHEAFSQFDRNYTAVRPASCKSP